MILIGHRVTKISGERHDIAEGAALNNISSNAVPTNIREGKSVNPKSKILIVEWEFKSDYDMDNNKKLAELLITGEVIYEVESKNFKRIMSEWKKTKQIKKEQLLPMLQSILNVAQVQGIILAKELNLPSPVQLLKLQEKQ